MTAIVQYCGRECGRDCIVQYRGRECGRDSGAARAATSGAQRRSSAQTRSVAATERGSDADGVAQREGGLVRAPAHVQCVWRAQMGDTWSAPAYGCHSHCASPLHPPLTTVAHDHVRARRASSHSGRSRRSLRAQQPSSARTAGGTLCHHQPVLHDLHHLLQEQEQEQWQEEQWQRQEEQWQQWQRQWNPVVVVLLLLLLVVLLLFRRLMGESVLVVLTTPHSRPHSRPLTAPHSY